MEHIDRTAARVSLGTLVGFVGGAAYATLRGFPLRATTLRVATSFALVGTVMFGIERVAFVALKQGEHQQRQDPVTKSSSEQRLLLTSHAFSGVVGGGLNGYLYQKKPLRGMLYFIPIMMGVSFLELKWEKAKQERRDKLLLESPSLFQEDETKKSNEEINQTSQHPQDANDA